MKNLILNKSKDEIQAKIKENCLTLLEEFIRVANEYKLQWWVDGGTLLGTVRNNKMIDWDDDIDIIMPREDYDKLCGYVHCQFNDRQFLFQISTTDDCFEVHAKLRLHDSTALTERECIGRHHRGMFLDVFPLDNCPEDVNVCDDVWGFTKTFAKHAGCERVYKRSHRFEEYNDALYAIHRLHEDSQYVANMAFWRYEKRPTILRKYWYDDTIHLQFENITVNVPVGYKFILSTWYGDDYLIPEQASNCHKAFVDPFNDYSNYNGCTIDEFYKLVQTSKK